MEPVARAAIPPHYSAIINSDDAWCKLLSSYDGTFPDEYGQAPNGWSELAPSRLRQGLRGAE